MARILISHASVQSLLAHPERLALLREGAECIGRPRAALDIAEAILHELRDGISA